MSALLSFLGGNAFRMLWGELSSAWTKHQDHKQELALLDKQEAAATAAHARNMEAARLHHELGLKEIVAQGNAHERATDDDAWLEVVRGTGKTSGIAWVDGWNQAIRPAFATLVWLAMALELWAVHFAMTDWYRDFAAVVIGVYFADRSLKHRGK